MAVRLSLRPDLDQNVDGLPIYVTGLLADTAPLVAYEERLQIHNAVGRCTVQVLDGSDPLPPGSSVYLDHATQEVVVAWPAYSQYVTPLANPGFESGDTSGWTFTPRGGSAVPAVDTTYRYEGARSLRWPGGRGMGSEGGIEVEAWNNTIGPCLPGQRVTTRFRGMYNPAGHNFGSRYQALVRFLDSDGNPIGAPARGYQFKGRFHNGRWNDAVVSASGPAGTAGVQLGAWLTGSGASTWMDAASWDVPSELGVDEIGVYQLVLRVRDSAGRSALWNGEIEVTDKDPIAVAILAKLTAWWPFDSVDGAMMADKQPDVLVGGMTDAYLQYGPSLERADGRSPGRGAPQFRGSVEPGSYMTEASSTGGPAVAADMYPAGGDWANFGWLWLDSLPTPSMSIVTRYDAGDDGGAASIGMRYLDGGAGRMQGWFGNGTYSSIVPSGNVQTGKWVFFLLQRRNNIMRMWVDGAPIGTEMDVTGIVPLNGPHTYFGSQGQYFFLKGRLQDWGWMRGNSLTDEEMAWMYNAGAGRTIEQIRAAAGV